MSTRGAGPRVQRRIVFGRHAGDSGCIEDEGRQVEPTLQFALPLLAQTRGTYHEHARVRLSREHLGEDQAGLHGLAEAHFICNEQATATPRADGQRRLELKRNDGEVCVRRRAQCVRRGRRIGQRGTREAAPSGRTHHPRRLRDRQRFDRFEWEQEPRPGTAIRLVSARDLDHRHIGIRKPTRDAPALAADPHRVART